MIIFSFLIISFGILAMLMNHGIIAIVLIGVGYLFMAPAMLFKIRKVIGIN